MFYTEFHLKHIKNILKEYKTKKVYLKVHLKINAIYITFSNILKNFKNNALLKKNLNEKLN